MLTLSFNENSLLEETFWILKQPGGQRLEPMMHQDSLIIMSPIAIQFIWIARE